MAAEPERAGAAQRELAALPRRGRALDGGAQHRGSVGVQVRGKRLPELAGDVGGDGRVERRLGERAAQEPRGALGRAAGAGHGGRLPQRGHGGGVGDGLGPQQVHRDVLRAGVLALEQPGGAGVPERALAGRQAAVEGGGDERVGEPVALEQPGGAQRVGQRGGVRRLHAGEPGGVPQRGGPAEDGVRAGQRRGALREPRQAPLDAARHLLRAEGAQPRRDLLGGRDPLGDEVAEQRVQQERVAAGDGVAGMGERGVRLRQPRAHQRLGGGGSERARADRRLGRRQQLGEQLRLRHRLARAHRAQHAERQLVEPAGELAEPAQRGRVGPVDVVGHEQQRRLLGEVARPAT